MVSELTTGRLPAGKIQFQKHMARHLVGGGDLEFIKEFRNFFLVRDPRLQIPSFARKRPGLQFDDLGWTEMSLLTDNFDGPILDAGDILMNPAAALSGLCSELGIPYDRSMLRWEPGKRVTDGAWGDYWYPEVWNTTGFGSYIDPQGAVLPGDLAELAERCMPIYQRLYERRLVFLISVQAAARLRRRKRMRDHVFLITGGAGGIGSATARLAADAGYRLVLAGRTKDKLESFASQLRDQTDVLTVPCDVSEWEQVEGLVRLTEENFGRLDVAFANAGLSPSTSFLGTKGDPPEEWRSAVLANVLGPP